MFAKDNKFTSEQMSAWFSIIKSVHEMTVGEDANNVILKLIWMQWQKYSSSIIRQMPFKTGICLNKVYHNLCTTHQEVSLEIHQLWSKLSPSEHCSKWPAVRLFWWIWTRVFLHYLHSYYLACVTLREILNSLILSAKPPYTWPHYSVYNFYNNFFQDFILVSDKL